MDKYVRGKVLGKGSFGSAILVTNKLDNKNYVIKEIDISRMPKAERDASEQEAKLLMALNHPNIVRCIECFTHMNKLCIVMDWCSEGDLYGLLQKRRGQPLAEDTIIDWLVQMCLGLKHVHDRKILHRDIKTQNVFMSSGGLLKLGDFGVSKVLNSTFQLATTAVGTPYYLSPEICQNKKYNQKSDIWSLGCVLYELATLKHAFEAPNMRALIQKIIKGSYPPMPSTRSRDLRELCDRMLTLDWQKRPSINDILATPVMKARIQKFLSATLQAHEFSHTIIHGRPKPGHLVVGAGAAAAAAAAAGGAGAAAAGGGAPGAAGAPGVAAGPAPSKFGAAPTPQAPVAAAQAAARPAAAAASPGAGRVGSVAAPAVGGVRQTAASPGGPANRAGAGIGAAGAGAGAGRVGAVPAAAGVGAAGGRFQAPAPGGAAAAVLKQAQDAAVAARAKAAEAVKQREEAMMALAQKQLQQQQQQQQHRFNGLSPPVALPQPQPARGWGAPSPALPPHRRSLAGQSPAAPSPAQPPPSPPSDRLPPLSPSSAKRAAEAEANAKRELDRAKAREVAALGAQREIERLRLEEQRRKLEADRLRQEADRRKREAARVEEERRAKAEEEARARLGAEEARRQREAEAKRRKAEEEARKKDAERAAKEKEREDMRAKIAAQRKEYQDRQAEAARNRAAAEQQLGRAAQQPEVQVLAGRPPRRQWSPPRAEDAARGRGAGEAAAAAGPSVPDREAPGPAGPSGAAGGGGAGAGRRGTEDYLSADQRRAVYEEQRAAAERNRRAVQQAERHGGIADFLGVPREPDDRGRQQQQQQDQQRRRPGSGQGAGAGAGSRPSASPPPVARAGPDISPDARRAAYLEMRAAAERNRAAVEGGARAAGVAGAARPVSPVVAQGGGGGGGSRPVTPPVPRPPTDPWAAKMARLEEERRRREQEILEFQRQHWQEVREARERNKRQIMAEVRGGEGGGAGTPPEGAARAPSPSPAAAAAAGRPASGGGPSSRPPTPPVAQRVPAAAVPCPAAAGGDEDDDMEFAAMVKDMQDVLLQGDGGRDGVSGGTSGDEDDIYNDEKHAAALAGQFLLNGQPVALAGVRPSDSLALKVEALRVFLETHLGTEAFLKVYRRLESLSLDDDETQVSAEFLAVLGSERLPYLQLVHQLIVCEENMHNEGA